jgi:Cysteine rich repeat
MRIHHFAIVSVFSLAALMSAAPSALAQQAAAMKYCKADFERLCPGVQPGGGRIIGCLKAHKEEVSIGCGKAIQAMKAKMGT